MEMFISVSSHDFVALASFLSAVSLLMEFVASEGSLDVFALDLNKSSFGVKPVDACGVAR